MSKERQKLFVGVLDNGKWTKEKLSAYLVKHAATNDDQYITDCQIMPYSETRFLGKSFAFVTFTDETCVDRCMEKRSQFNDEYGITIKRLLPDSITKCERLISSTEMAIRITLPDPLFNDVNIRSYLGKYGKIMDVKMLEEENTGGICFLTFEDFDSSDRVILDIPHYLNGQLLIINKYAPPEYICNLSQYRFIDPSTARGVKRWYPILRNFNELICPLEMLYKTQLALVRYNMNKQISSSNSNLNQIKENLLELENKTNNVKQDLLHLYHLNEQLDKQIEEGPRKNERNREEYEDQIEQHRQKNQALQDAIRSLQNNS